MSNKTIREIAMAWKEYKRPYVKQSTMAAYVLILENHIIPYFGDGCSLHETEVQTFVLQKLKNGLSIKSVKDILIVLKIIIAKTKCAKSENETSKTSLFSLLNSQQFFPMFRRLERIRKLNTK